MGRLRPVGLTAAGRAAVVGFRMDGRLVRLRVPMPAREDPTFWKDFDWRAYEPAIRRWERVLMRPAPHPVDERGRLSPAFVEWMGFPEGWVVCRQGAAC